jgi:hypothetical protein
MSLVSPSQSNPGETIEASDINTPVNQLAAVINGGIDNTNIAAGAGIDGSKFANNSINGSKLSSIYGPQGFMRNGKIVTSVSANDLTVSIKTLAGADPSASDPVYVRIGNDERTITTATSKTLNDGTNWFNSGSTSLATFEVDYFVYLIWNTTPATDRVDLGFARIPYGRTYADFSGTTTNEKYLAFSGADTPASTDEVEVVGRFNATLSATAAFNWSIPATSVIVNRPIFETRELTASLATANTTLGNGTQTAIYTIKGRDCAIIYEFILGTTSAMGTNPRITLPFSIGTKYSTGNENHQVGTAWLEDRSVVNAFGPVISSGAIGATAVDIYAWLVSATYLQITSITSTVPFTWGNNDYMEANIRYEIA